MRKPRKGEHTCRCSAYGFPHRFGGGACTGISIVRDHWEQYYGHEENCQHCNLLSNASCQIIEGIEHPRECAVLQEFIQDNEIHIRSFK